VEKGEPSGLRPHRPLRQPYVRPGREESVEPSSVEAVTIGAATVDHRYAVTNLPVPDGGAYARSEERALGGVGANVAVGLARLGRESGLIARLGPDDHGQWVRDRLGSRDIDTVRVSEGPERTTRSLVFRDPDGQRSIVTVGDSARKLRLDEGDIRYLRGAGAVFITAYVPDSVSSELASRAKRSSFPPLAFDLSGPVAELRGRGTESETIERVLDVCGLFVTDEVAAESYFGSAAEAVDRLAAADVPRAAVTRGADGATLVSPDGTTDIDAFDVDVVDTTGAGDAFTAALIDRWLLGDAAPAPAGRFAAAAAAVCCTRDHAQPGLPPPPKVRSLLDR